MGEEGKVKDTKMASTSKEKPNEAEDGVEDMIKLSSLNENTILENLRVRYEKEKIYTYVGSILVAVNPYRMFSIYGLDMVKKYEGQPMGELPPHLFAVGSSSYCKMIKDKENQVIVISGESGAGKTESTKLVMQYLAAVNKSRNNLITEQILEANPLLESFGNAKTIRNDNSSRFGKYIEVFFKDRSIVGAKTSEYLLEKSRIVTQAAEERNYHVFYEMLESMSDEQKSKYGLQTAPKYFYLNQGGSPVIPGRDDAENFRKLTAAMEILSFQKAEKETIYKILASVLHIGNVYFHLLLVDNHDTVQLGSDAEIKWVSYLLGLSDEWLKQALTSKVTEARGERVVSPYNMDQALDARDAISKALYSRLFTWLVERINQIICKAEREKSSSLAVLDIFGFEDFHMNSFEQLCINFANETLQFFFNQHVFRLEQKEYEKEKIKWEHIDFRDNKPTLDLISTKPAGILHILDDESNFPQATDMSFLEKCHFHHSENSLYSKPRMSDPEFSITHYAGKIRYNVKHFLEKNKDTLRSDVVELMCESKNKIISQMFKELRDRLITKTLSKTTGRYVTLKPRTATVAASFNESLIALIDTMSRCNPYFVRCIKPNVTKSAMVFDEYCVMEQLRYSGMLETIRIRKLGYPIRVKFPYFIERYRCLIQGPYHVNLHLPADVCAKILASQGSGHTSQFQIGTTKVFMKEHFEQRLDMEATKLQRKAALVIQITARRFLARKRFLKVSASCMRIQAAIKMAVTRKKFKAIRNGIVRAQATFRMYRQRIRYIQIRQRIELERQARRKQEAQEKMEREKREREARAAANVINLEIPGELAFVYNKLDDWKLPHTGTNINVVADVKPMEMGYRLPVDINSHAFSKYMGAYFKKGDWGVEIEPIKTSFTNVQGDLSYKALSVFKLILRFMMEKDMSEKKQKILSDYIVQLGLQNEGLRDEILCQLTNQTWKNQNVLQAEKAWLLLAMCLSCFSPGSTLFKYLLKYVSDIGVNGYKIVCQHKILQSANVSQPRIYPPCFLEWVASQRKANMALQVKFPDDRLFVGHVESWTFGEMFTSHILKQRGLPENAHGWTLVLQEEQDYYELMGYDYVLDLISEIELAPGFPVCRAYFLVSSDRSQERINQRRHIQTENPHNPDRDRVVMLVGPLPQMIKREITQPSSGNVADLSKMRASSKRTTVTTETRTVAESSINDELRFSMTSVLNQRPTDIYDSGLSRSKLNTRYTKRQAPAPPIANGHVSNGLANGEITTITEAEGDMDLSGNVLNNRYLQQNGDTRIYAETSGDLSSSKLNTRYVKSKVVSQAKTGAAGQISRKDKGHVRDRSSLVSDNISDDKSDWSHWVEDVFNSALNDHYDMSEGRSLEQRIKGGGKGIPGLTTQPTQIGQFGLGLNGQAPLSQNIGLGGVGLSNGVGVNDQVQQLMAQQLLAQQQAAQQQAVQQQAAQQQQQQAVLQAYLQAQRQEQQQQQQQALLQAALQQQQPSALSAQQQTSALKAALQQQELQNKLLKQSIEQEFLKQQLLQIQTSPTQLLSPASSNTSVVGVPSPGSRHPETGQFVNLAANQFPAQRTRVGGVSSVSAEPAQPPPTAQKKVSFIKGGYEDVALQSQQPKKYLITSHVAAGSSQPVVVGIKTDGQETSQQEVTSTVNTAAVSPPMSPPPKFADTTRVAYQQHHIPPPPPPPPPPIVSSNDKSKTIRIRVGNIVWPPIREEEEKHLREVGRLSIDEKVTADLNNRYGGKKIAVKTETKENVKPKSILKKTEDEETKPPVKRAKSLMESHASTLQLLEGKIGPKVQKEPPKPKTMEAVSQTTDTLKSVKKAVTASTSTTGIPAPPPPAPPPPPPGDIPPPLPSRPPPAKVTADIRTTVTEVTTKTVEVTTQKQAKKEETKLIDFNALERSITELFPQNKTFFLMYNKVPWTLHIRKEVFWPSERLDKPLALHLLFCQVVKDVYNSACVRISKEERIKMRSHLEAQGIDQNNVLTKEVSNQLKKIIIDTAKEWPCYFCRMFPVASSGHYTGVKYLGVSHSGLRLVSRERSFMEDHLTVIEEIRFEDVVDTVMPSSSTMQLNLKSKSVMFFSQRAGQMKEMVDKFCQESDKDNKYAVAIKDYVTRESTLLSFRRGDIIKLMDPEMNLDEGWLYGSLNGIVGMLPAENVRPLARHEIETSNMKVHLVRPPSREGHLNGDDRSDTSQGTLLVDGKFSMMEFALLHFRESIEKFEMQRTDEGSIRGTIKMIESLKLRNLQQQRQRRGSSDWTWREQAELVKWTRSPIQASLLKLQSSELNKLALECFIAIMMFMEDYPKQRGMTDYDCVMRILRSCHKYPELRDEVYCQLCKQTTNNRSMKQRSITRGWRLFALVAAFCDCSESLRPYLFKYLETTASDTSRHSSSAAGLCLQNLRKTFKFGGRKNTPLKEEVQALADGRNSKRFPFIYSGSDTQGGMLQIKSCSIVLDAIEYICNDLNIVDSIEMEEYTLFLRTRDNKFNKLSREEYVLDVTAQFVREKKDFDLIFQRTVWFFPLMHIDNDIYVDMMFNQCVLDYLDGLLVVVNRNSLNQDELEEIAVMGTLLFKAQHRVGLPTMKDLDSLVPRTLTNHPLMRPQQWLNKIHDHMRGILQKSPVECRVRFLEILVRWPLFGSTFFLIKSVVNVTGECMLAVNKNGIQFLKKETHEPILKHPFSEILSTRRYRSDYNVNYLDMKLGNLMVQKILRIETDQGSDISNLIGQYMQVINRHRKRPDRPVNGVYN